MLDGGEIDTVCLVSYLCLRKIWYGYGSDKVLVSSIQRISDSTEGPDALPRGRGAPTNDRA